MLSMSTISLKSQNIHQHTLINNLFIDHYMPIANGDYVKVYIYMLRLVVSGTLDFTIEQVAKQMNLIQSDVIRAIHYWSEQKLIEVTYDDNEEIIDIGFLSLEKINATLPMQQEPPKKKARKKQARLQQRPQYSMEEVAMYVEHDEFKELLYITERYVQKPLTQSDTNVLLGFVDWLGLPMDVVEFLVEHCVNNGHRHMNYMEKVAMDWADHNLSTVEQAKVYTQTYNKNYHRIFRSLGISNRTPTPNQISLMDKWVTDYNFAIEVIEYACEKTIAIINKPELNYVDAILTRWNNKGVKSIDAITKNDQNNDKAHYKIFKILGIGSHNPTDDQKTLIETWLKDYGFSLDLVEFACRRTIASINKPDLNYVNKILMEWNNSHVNTVADAEKLEAKFKSNKAKKQSPAKNNKFINHQQHQYDFDDIEKKMDALLDKKIDGM